VNVFVCADGVPENYILIPSQTHEFVDANERTNSIYISFRDSARHRVAHSFLGNV